MRKLSPYALWLTLAIYAPVASAISRGGVEQIVYQAAISGAFAGFAGGTGPALAGAVTTAAKILDIKIKKLKSDDDAAEEDPAKQDGAPADAPAPAPADPYAGPAPRVPIDPSLFNSTLPPDAPLPRQNPFDRTDDFFSRPRTGDANLPPSMLSEKYPEACLIEDHGSRLPNQYNSGMCLEFASVAINEHFINLANPDQPKVNISPWDLLQHRRASSGNFNRFTDEPFVYRDALLRNGLVKNREIPEIKRTVLFANNGAGDQDPGGISLEKFKKLKRAIRENKPVLFEWRPHFPEGTPQASQYWHANVCVGYNDQKQVLLCRDSAMGKESHVNGNSYRDIFEMPYSLALSSGKHAAAYELAASYRAPRGNSDRGRASANCRDTGDSAPAEVALSPHGSTRALRSTEAGHF